LTAKETGIHLQIWKKNRQDNEFMTQIKEIDDDESRARYVIQNLGENRGIGAGVPINQPMFAELDDTELAGFEADKKNILGHLLDRKVWRCPLVSIVGPGGLGKTTVPQKVYSEVCMYFQVAYCRCTTDVLCIYESL
jgi:hypothetical protein